jgi:hypothetical protein
MSQRLGMADGRCFTINNANSLVNDYIMKQNNIQYADNYAYRKFLQQKGPDALDEITQLMKEQQSMDNSTNSVNKCMSCDSPLLKLSDIY